MTGSSRDSRRRGRLRTRVPPQKVISGVPDRRFVVSNRGPSRPLRSRPRGRTGSGHRFDPSRPWARKGPDPTLRRANERGVHNAKFLQHSPSDRSDSGRTHSGRAQPGPVRSGRVEPLRTKRRFPVDRFHPPQLRRRGAALAVAGSPRRRQVAGFPSRFRLTRSAVLALIALTITKHGGESAPPRAAMRAAAWHSAHHGSSRRATWRSR